MNVITIKKCIEFLISKIQIIVGSKFWIIKTAAVLTIISFLFSTPWSFKLPFQLNATDINNCKTCSQTYKWGIEYINLQIENPFSGKAQAFLTDKPQEDGFISHLNKRWSRITVPVIAWIFHLNMTHVYFLQVILGVFFLILIMKLIRNLTEDKVVGFLSGLIIGSLYLSKTFNVDYIHYDCFAYFFLALAAIQKRPFFAIPFFLLAAFTDERAFIAMPLIMLIWITAKAGSNLKWKDLFKLREIIATFAITLISYFILRQLLAKHLNIVADESYIGVGMILTNLKSIPLAVFATLEVSLLLIIVPVVLSILNKQYVFACLFSMGTSCILLTSFMVADLSRSISYVFPAILCGIVYLCKTESKRTYQTIILATALGCFCFPTNDYAMGAVAGESWILPLFLKYFKTFI